MASSNPKLSEDALKSSREVTSKNHVPSTDFVKPLPEPKKHDGLRGQSLQETQDELDESVLIDWLKLNVGDHEECEKVLNGVKARVFKPDTLINELRAMGHDLSDDYIVDLNFFRKD
ncbi:hypothetical protein Tco_0807336 [Tanacetum coccineum]